VTLYRDEFKAVREEIEASLAELRAEIQSESQEVVEEPTTISRIFPWDANQWRKINDSYWQPIKGWRNADNVPMAGMIPVAEVPVEVLNGDLFYGTDLQQTDETDTTTAEDTTEIQDDTTTEEGASDGETQGEETV
jgi:hypothetical protein